MTKANIQNFFKTDRAILLICIGVALVFWLLLKLSNDYRSSIVFEVSYNLPEDKTFLETPPEKLNIGLVGRGFDLMYLYLQNIRPRIVLNISDETSTTIPASQIKDKARQQLSNVDVVDVDVDYIFLSLEEQDEKKVPINFHHEIAVVENYQLKDSMFISPDSVIIRGPYSLIDGFNSWDTEPLQLNNVNENVRTELALVSPFDQVIHLEPKKVRVSFDVEQSTEKSMFVPINIINAPDSLKVFPEMVKLSCTVGLSRYDSVAINDFMLEVDLRNISPNTENNTVPILLTKAPQSVSNIIFSPKSVEFFFVR